MRQAQYTLEKEKGYETLCMELAFFQDFLLHFNIKASKSSITHGRGTRFWQLAKKDIPSFENNSASFKNRDKGKS